MATTETGAVVESSIEEMRGAERRARLELCRQHVTEVLRMRHDFYDGAMAALDVFEELTRLGLEEDEDGVRRHRHMFYRNEISAAAVVDGMHLEEASRKCLMLENDLLRGEIARRVAILLGEDRLRRMLRDKKWETIKANAAALRELQQRTAHKNRVSVELEELKTKRVQEILNMEREAAAYHHGAERARLVWEEELEADKLYAAIAASLDYIKLTSWESKPRADITAAIVEATSRQQVHQKELLGRVQKSLQDMYDQ